MQFAIEIARGGNDKIRDIPRLAVLTARAREFKFALELSNSSVINRNYHLAGQANGLTDWGIGRVSAWTAVPPQSALRSAPA
eukprot:6143313-Prorocentrum_lima.AAC.1